MLLEVVESCRSCGVHEPSGDTHPPHVPDLNLKFNEKLWLDMANLDRHLRFEVLIMVDEAEAEVALELVVEPTASKCWDAYYARWGSLRGHPGEMVSDGGGELAGPAFGDNADGAGILRTLTPAKSSPSHGRVERVIRTVRHSLDRLKEDERTAAWVESDYRRAVQTIENGIRNEVGLSSGGTMSTASVRSTGRCSSVHRNVLDMGAAEAEKSESVDKVVALAKKVYREAIASRTLREILHSKPHADDDAPELKSTARRPWGGAADDAPRAGMARRDASAGCLRRRRVMPATITSIIAESCCACTRGTADCGRRSRGHSARCRPTRGMWTPLRGDLRAALTTVSQGTISMSGIVLRLTRNRKVHQGQLVTGPHPWPTVIRRASWLMMTGLRPLMQSVLHTRPMAKLYQSRNRRTISRS